MNPSYLFNLFYSFRTKNNPSIDCECAIIKRLNLIQINLGKRRPGTEKKQRKMTATNEN